MNLSCNFRSVLRASLNSLKRLNISRESGNVGLVLLLTGIIGVFFGIGLLNNYQYVGSDSALHQAAVEAARCVVPTEGDCLLVKQGKLDIDYDWYGERRPQGKDERFYIEQHSYTANLQEGLWEASGELILETPVNPYVGWETILVPSRTFAVKLNQFETRAKGVDVRFNKQEYTPKLLFGGANGQALSNFPKFKQDHENTHLDVNVSSYSPVNGFSNANVFDVSSAGSQIIPGDSYADYSTGKVGIPLGYPSFAQCKPGHICGVAGSVDWRENARLAFKVFVRSKSSGKFYVDHQLLSEGELATRIDIYDAKGVLSSRGIGGREKDVTRANSDGYHYFNLRLRGPAGAHGGSSFSGDNAHQNYVIPRGGSFDIHVRVENELKRDTDAEVLVAYYYDSYDSGELLLDETVTIRLRNDETEKTRKEICCEAFTNVHSYVNEVICLTEFSNIFAGDNTCYESFFLPEPECSSSKESDYSFPINNSAAQIKYAHQVAGIPVCNPDWVPNWEILRGKDEIVKNRKACGGWEMEAPIEPDTEANMIEQPSLIDGLSCELGKIKRYSENPEICYVNGDKGGPLPSELDSFDDPYELCDDMGGLSGTVIAMLHKKFNMIKALKDIAPGPKVEGAPSSFENPSRAMFNSGPKFFLTGDYEYGTPVVKGLADESATNTGVSTRGKGQSQASDPDTLVLRVLSRPYKAFVPYVGAPNTDDYTLTYTYPGYDTESYPDFPKIPEDEIKKYLKSELLSKNDYPITSTYPFNKERTAEIPWWGYMATQGRDLDFNRDCDADVHCYDREIEAESLEDALRQYAAVLIPEAGHKGSTNSFTYEFSYTDTRQDVPIYTSGEDLGEFPHCSPFQRVACGWDLTSGQVDYLGRYGAEGPAECYNGEYFNCDPVAPLGQNFATMAAELYSPESVEARAKEVAKEVLEDLLPSARLDCAPTERGCAYVSVDVESDAPHAIIDVSYNFPILSPFHWMIGKDHIFQNHRKREAMEIYVHGG